MPIFWTKYSPLENHVSATDPLALDYMAQQLGYLPLPNFTTRTARARYYSVVCYGLMICEKAIEKYGYSMNDKTVSRLYELYEKYWAYAVVISYEGNIKERDDNEKELRGKRGAIKAVSNGLKTLGDSYRLLSRQLELGGLGAYRSSLEKFGLIKSSSLSLTMRGHELAESFMPVGDRMRTQYEELLTESIHQQKILEKHGQASISNFGRYARLDLFSQADHNLAQALDKERGLLIKYIIEGDEITHATARMAVSNRDRFQNSYLEGISTLANIHTTDATENIVRASFETIYCFELLSIQLNNAFCALLKAAFDKGGTITVKELVPHVAPFLQTIYEHQLVERLTRSPQYHELAGYYHGKEFLNLLSALQSGVNPEQFIRSIHKLHSAVETKRKSGLWFDISGDEVNAFTGYSYSKENMGRQHTYKLPNLFSIISDLGWTV
ncbi:MAG: hypothetical protein GXZ09_02815 [Syntrophomonadaceae bacterium]|nr:hypothetical protein [Syntrophomonadaceae bacterium]